MVGAGRLVLLQARARLLDSGSIVLRSRRPLHARRDDCVRCQQLLPTTRVGRPLASLSDGTWRRLRRLPRSGGRVRTTSRVSGIGGAVDHPLLGIPVAPEHDGHALCCPASGRTRAATARLQNGSGGAGKTLPGAGQIADLPTIGIPRRIRARFAARAGPGPLPRVAQRHVPGGRTATRLCSAL